MNKLIAMMKKFNMDEAKVMKLIEKEIRNKEYHKKRNQEISQLIKKAKALGL